MNKELNIYEKDYVLYFIVLYIYFKILEVKYFFIRRWEGCILD